MTKCQQYFDTNGEVNCGSLESSSTFKNFPIHIHSATETLVQSIDAATVKVAAPVKPVVPKNPVPSGGK
jgi:carbohydrate-selective porin OprB